MSGTAVQLGADLIESDRRYFEMGAEVRALSAGVLATMPQHAGLAAATVIHRVPTDGTGDTPGWVAEAEAACRTAGCRDIRVYLDAPDDALGTALVELGFAARVEIGYAASAVGPAPRLPLQLVEATGEAGWHERTLVHALGDPPDGHADDPAALVRLERDKVADGLVPYVATVDGEPVGAVCSMATGSSLRCKNLVVARGWRRRGVASAILHRLDQLARSRSQVLCTFAVAGSAGDALYRSVGMQAACAQLELTRPLRPLA